MIMPPNPTPQACSVPYSSISSGTGYLSQNCELVVQFFSVKIGNWYWELVVQSQFFQFSSQFPDWTWATLLDIELEHSTLLTSALEDFCMVPNSDNVMT